MRSLIIITTLLLCAVSTFAQERPPSTLQTYRWGWDKENSDEIVVAGESLRIIRANGVTVAVAGINASEGLMFDVFVLNATGNRLTVRPEDFYLTHIDKDGRLEYARPAPPEKIASKYRSRARWANIFRSFAAGMATQTSTYQTNESGNVTAYGTGGAASGTYSGTSTTTVTNPNRQAQQNAARANAETSAEADARAASVMNTALFANTLFPNQYISGYVYFNRKKKHDPYLSIVIDNVTYTFGFRLSK